MDIKTRRAKLDDFDKVQELNYQLFVHDYEFDPELFKKAPFTKRNEKYYKKAITNDNYLCLVVEAEDKIIGYLIGKQREHNSSRPVKTGELDNMLVLKKYRRKKIGKQLVDKFINWCEERDIKSVFVWAYTGNRKAVNFYKKYGFKPLSMRFEYKLKND